MTAIGIDLQPSFLQIAISEGGGPATPVSDGCDKIITVPSKEPSELVPLMAGLLRRVAGHLGVETSALPAPVLAADEPLGDSAVAAMVQGGWRSPETISATEALLAAAMTTEGEPVEHWISVALGERTLAVQAFLAHRETYSARAYAARVVEGCGYEAVAQRACKLAGLEGEMDRQWADAVMDFAEEFSQAGERPVRWRGPVCNGRAPPMLRLGDLRAWPEVVRTETTLASLVEEARADAGDTCRVVVGGVGSVWPFAAKLGDGPRQEIVPFRPELIAVGAAAAGVYHLGIGGNGADAPTLIPASGVLESSASGNLPRPPWERQHKSTPGPIPPWERRPLGKSRKDIEK